ncbi:HlyD family efflux transporter periplasmic adaptor subunit [Granulosicoccus antarcticus]|uniref:Putative multidrug resistance protein EmrK n=1 Tax=Granulosicoccus antarcticus IMCC3135 TaxID=1192854 RepID=A0A2Z2NXK3_9GAMM|nr:HlyD family efflux transporter periplasmic adaptor subunit [Granulosicoccus antarcticus]ASJ74711.1 putative multidrug resistance protein EmrK [Granulosicoccus antarcticus IMCC3135]
MNQTESAPDHSENDTSSRADSQRKRKHGLGILLGVVVLGAAGYSVWHHFGASASEETDNAYVQGPIVQVTPQLPGTVVEIAAQDTDFVAADQVLVRLDPVDAQLALEQAEADLAQTVREVSTLYGNNAMLSAQIESREADLARATSQADQYRGDLSRRMGLAKSGAISSEELKHTQAQLDVAESSTQAAKAALAAAREQLTTSLLLTANTTPAKHPKVKRAAAQMRNAMLALERTEIRAPVDGYVAQRRVQLGQRVLTGSSLMSVIPLQDVWVDANFKESQLADMRIGQSVELVADIYGDDVVYKGTVQGLGAGTGAAFALLPAQNATGNWIKVVQRVPVRISLDGGELEEHPLRIGLSLTATVHTDDTSGSRLSGIASTDTPEMLTTAAKVAAASDKDEALIQSIIEQNISDIPTLPVSENSTN